MADIEISDDDDMFLMGGPVKPLSMYTKLTSDDVDDDDDDDDDDDIISVPLSGPSGRKRGRGRPTKRAREPVAAVKQNGHAAKKTKSSVFDEVSEDDDEVHFVSEVTPKSHGSLRDSLDNDAALQLAQAQRVLEMEANENRIREEAEREAQREIELNERMREEEMRRQKEAEQREAERKKVGLASGGKPIQLMVRCGKDKRIKMRIKTTDSVIKMLAPFCKKFGLDKKKAQMEFDGEELTEQDTPQSLELEGDEIIDITIRS